MNKTLLIYFFLIFFCLLLLSVAFFDIDFQWRVRFIHDVLSLGFIPKTDIYTYTMPSFPFVDHAFLVSLIFTIIYDIFGYGAVAIFVSAITTLVIIYTCGSKKWLIPLLAASYFTGFAVRDHVFSFAFLAILLKESEFFLNRGYKHLLLLPIFMMLWANTHGGFLLGLMYIWGYVLVEVVFRQRKSLQTKLTCVAAAEIATLATLITPYGIDTWREVARTMFSSTLRLYVSEWRPIQGLSSFGLLILTVFFLLSVIQTKKLHWKHIFAALLFFQAIMVNRVIPLFALATISTISDGYDQFMRNNSNKIDKKRLLIATNALIFISIFICIIELGFSFSRRPDLSYFYPVAAVSFLSQNPSPGHIFSLPHWNSYIMWKLPSEKVFLDTRMFVWEQKSRTDELDSASVTFIQIANGRENYQKVFNHFCIDTVIWGNKTINGTWFDYNASLSFITKLKNDGWNLVFENKNSEIYRRPLPDICSNYKK